MTDVRLDDYVSGGYFIAKPATLGDARVGLVTLSPCIASVLPTDWALRGDWTRNGTPICELPESEKAAREWEIAGSEFPALLGWSRERQATDTTDSWSTFATSAAAQAFAERFLPHDQSACVL